MKTPPRALVLSFLAVDLGFLVYWCVTLARAIPPEYLFQEYTNPLLVAWNWSFLPLDLLVSASGLTSLWLARRNDSRWKLSALLSLALTSCSGLQAIAFWVLRGEFDLLWWAPNLFLLLYPLVWLPRVLASAAPRKQHE